MILPVLADASQPHITMALCPANDHTRALNHLKEWHLLALDHDGDGEWRIVTLWPSADFRRWVRAGVQF